MRKILTATLAALTLAGTIGAGSASAQDHRDWHGGRDWHDHDNSGAAVAAGIAGLAVGAALASGDEGRYDGYRGGYYYGSPDYAYRYYYGDRYDGPRRCRTRTVWDPYARAYIQRTRCWR